MVEELAFARRVSERLNAALKSQLRAYRLVLLLPSDITLAGALPEPPHPPERAVRPDPVPLREPNPRLLRRLDPQLLEFVKANPEIESIVTRELVRDVDRRILNVEKLLGESSLELSFSVDEIGRVGNRRLVRSSGVPSIDHLALELARVLERYGLLSPLKGLRQVSFSIRISDSVEVALSGMLEEGSDRQAVLTQLRTILTLARFALAKESVFLLQDVEIEESDTGVSMRRVYDKQELLAFLTDYFNPKPQPGAVKAAPQQQPL